MVSLSVFAPQTKTHCFVTGCQVSWIKKQRCWQCWRDSYLVLQQVGSKKVNMLTSGHNVPWEQSQNQNKRPPFHVHLNVCDAGHCEERPQFANYCSSRTQTLQLCLTERKTGLQKHDVKICKYGIWKIFSIPHIKFSISFHIPYRFFPSIPYSMA